MTTAEILSKASLFRPLSDEQLNAAVWLGQVKQFDTNEVIFEQEEQANTIYVLQDGLVSLRIKAPEELDVNARVYRDMKKEFSNEREQPP
jgi:CRP-like cAMP-binding protein